MIDLFRRARVRQEARKEAVLSVDGSARHITETLGTSPVQEKTSIRYREAVQTVAAQGVLREHEEEVQRLEDLRPVLGNAHLMTAALVGLTLIEFWGALQLLRTMGFAPSSRAFAAVGLALALIGVTTAVAQSTASEPAKAPRDAEVTSENEGADEAPQRVNWRGLLVPALYTLLIAALAAARVGAQDAEDTSALLTFSDAIVTVAITAGPAWMAALVASRRAPALELARRLSLARRRLRRAERRDAQARKLLASVDERTAAHTDAVARAEAAYSLEHERTRAAVREGLIEPADVHPGRR
jgi:hypothetical protein